MAAGDLVDRVLGTPAPGLSPSLTLVSLRFVQLHPGPGFVMRVSPRDTPDGQSTARRVLHPSAPVTKKNRGPGLGVQLLLPRAQRRNASPGPTCRLQGPSQCPVATQEKKSVFGAVRCAPLFLSNPVGPRRTRSSLTTRETRERKFG
jgi:hypothetical protein